MYLSPCLTERSLRAEIARKIKPQKAETFHMLPL